MSWKKLTFLSPEEALSPLQSGHNVFIHGTSATPFGLIEGLVAQASRLQNVTLHHLHVEGEAPYAQPAFAGIFRVNNLFTGGNLRRAVNEGRADYVPIFLSEIPYLFRRRIIPLDVALVQVSPPDKNGFCTLGTSVDVAVAATQSAKIIIAEVNHQMPRSHGDGTLHVSKIHKAIEVDRPLPSPASLALSEVELKIGQFVAGLVEDGATLQMGIGAIPDASLAALVHHRGLGIHTEMFSDGVIDLVERGVITNEHKAGHPGHIVAGFVVGSRNLYDFVDDNPLVRMLDIAYVNDTHTIRQNPKVTAINSAIEVDLTGQVCADSIGTSIYSGVGGQMDFIRGASLSEGGKPIIALPSVTSKGESRIVTYLHPGAGVVTTRAHVHYIVTEYGVANLYGQNLRQRAKALIEIAHPNHRERLEKECYACLKGQ
ncbi:MAG: acetyl-CoA hydrolase/transferase family protein [Microscillaceae bacterium]|nr:acetyl-CoA hydrolase/transferase family protein [Microscillaceae bacterium]